ncbi:MAG: hypothetical protein U9N81_02640 [Bacillota bacterium]|nr:hypothetical protein [Bacillota bacterium]
MMKITEKLRQYRCNCKPGEYDSDVYIDLSIFSESGLSFEAIPVAIAILDKLPNINFEEHDASMVVKDIDRNYIPIALDEMKEKGFIEEA